VTDIKRIEKGMYWDRAWSLVRGCSKVSDGCLNCWAERENHMRSFNPNEKVKAQYEGLTDGDGRFNGQIRLMVQNRNLPLIVKKPTVWAVWNDLFHDDVPGDFIYGAFNRMRKCEQHTFIVLTKRPERMKMIFDGFKIYNNYLCDLPNVWLGVTTENQEQADKRIPILLQIPAVVRFVSVEPMLGPVVLRRKAANEQEIIQATLMDRLEEYSRPIERGIDWVICGGESGPGVRPLHPDWARYLRDQCVAAGVPFFFKQLGEFREIRRYWTFAKYADTVGMVSRIVGHGRTALLNADDSDLVNGGPEHKVYPISHLERVGKKIAGRELDGRTWDEFPEVK